jgi:hypothetical protein
MLMWPLFFTGSVRFCWSLVGCRCAYVGGYTCVGVWLRSLESLVELELFLSSRESLAPPQHSLTLELSPRVLSSSSRHISLFLELS